MALRQSDAVRMMLWIIGEEAFAIDHNAAIDSMNPERRDPLALAILYPAGLPTGIAERDCVEASLGVDFCDKAESALRRFFRHRQACATQFLLRIAGQGFAENPVDSRQDGILVANLLFRTLVLGDVPGHMSRTYHLAFIISQGRRANQEIAAELVFMYFGGVFVAVCQG